MNEREDNFIHTLPCIDLTFWNERELDLSASEGVLLFLRALCCKVEGIHAIIHDMKQ